MLHSKTLNSTLRDREAWIFRRQKGIPNNKKLFVLAYEVETGNLRTPGQIYSKQTAIAIADR